ncbi:MAG: hypothetical protein R6W92_08720, partial [Desulfocurvibacter africanus]
LAFSLSQTSGPGLGGRSKLLAFAALVNRLAAFLFRPLGLITGFRPKAFVRREVYFLVALAPFVNSFQRHFFSARSKPCRLL